MTNGKWLIIILSIAAIFRFVGLTHAPPSLNWDEASIGYNAYSILKTGRDEWGSFMPLDFKAFGEHKLPGMIYASIPGIAIFGLNDFGLRVTPALIGLIAVILIYFLGKKLFNPQLGLIAASLMAISPWAVHFSRVSFEAGLAMVFTMGSIYFLLTSKRSPPAIWFSMIFAVLSVYTYNSTRILLPILFAVYFYKQIIPRKNLLPVLVVGLILLSPVIVSLTSSEGRVRWGTLNIANQKSFYDGISQSRGYTHLPDPLPRLIHNKLTHYVYQFSYNYLEMFSTEFLIFRGGVNTQRSVQGMGLLYFFELPLLILGLFKLKNSRDKILIPWLLLAPIPSILTIDSPSTVRALAMLPALILIESLGATILWDWLRKRKIISALFAVFVIWNIAYFAYQLYFVNPVKYADSWLYGHRQAISFISAHYSEVSKIYLTNTYGEPYIFTLFYTKFDPHTFQTTRVERTTDPTGWVHVNSFDKYNFTIFSGLDEPKEIVARNSGKLLMITGLGQLPGEYHRDLSITAPNWEVMFEGTIQEGKQ